MADRLPIGSRSSTQFGASRGRFAILCDAAREYIRRGFSPVPIPNGQKGPIIRNWLHLKLKSHEVGKAFADSANIGLILGVPSRNLVDVDLDCPEARELADIFLPSTPAVTGRTTSPRSHRWYICPELQTVRHRDPVTGACILEVRGAGCQTLVGPSIHPSGEPYDRLMGEPALVELKALVAAVKLIADNVIRGRHGELKSKQVAPPPPRPAAAQITDHRDKDRELILRRATAYLGKIPPAISGQGGHKITFIAAIAMVHGFALTEAEAFDLLSRVYNPKCQPPWRDWELEHKIRDAAEKPHNRPRGHLLGGR